MRLVPSLLLFLAGAALLPAAEATLVRIWPGWREADSFDRISEYFGGRETHGRERILRSRPDARAGYYFLVRVKSTSALPGARFRLSVIRPDAVEAQTTDFPTEVPAGETVFHLGLTGEAWPGGKAAEPLAWKLNLVAGDGRPLAQHQSFLWEKPAK